MAPELCKVPSLFGRTKGEVAVQTAMMCKRIEAQGEHPDARKQLQEYLSSLPGHLIEEILPYVVVSLSDMEAKKQRGLTVALECVPQPTMKRLYLGPSFPYMSLKGGEVAALEDTIRRLPLLTDVNLSVTCTDGLLNQLSSNCQYLEALTIEGSTIKDVGLLSLAGITLDGSSLPIPQGCFKITSLNLLSCNNINPESVAVLLKHLPILRDLRYEDTAKSVYTLALLEPTYRTGQRTLALRHLEQSRQHLNFSRHPKMWNLITKVFHYKIASKAHLKKYVCCFSSVNS